MNNNKNTYPLGPDWTLLGHGNSIDRTDSDPAMLGRWTINYDYNSSKSYNRFLESQNQNNNNKNKK